MPGTTDATDGRTDSESPDANTGGLARAIMRRELHSGTVASPDGERLIAHIMPANLEEVDKIAAEYGFERVDDEMDRRVFEPEGA